MSVFEENSYKSYLKKILTSFGESRGLRSQMAKFLGCQTGYVSQVLNAHVHFSLEHAYLITKFLKLGPEESEFFILLVSKEKAGSKGLEEHYTTRINEIREKRSQIKERIKVKGAMSKEARITYYSQWYYAAIHVAVTVKNLRTKDNIAKRLNLDGDLVSETLDFLESHDLVINEGGVYLPGNGRIHLEKKSPLVIKHHTNWRIEAIKSLEKVNDKNLHYSGVISLSVKDGEKIKEMMLKMIEDMEVILKPSPEEEIFSISMDFFKL